MKNKKVGAVIAAAIVIGAVVFGKVSLVRVNPGYCSVMYSINGGVKDKVLTQGWHFKSPTVKTTSYTVGLEQSYLTADKKGDSPDDDSFSASSSEGKAMQLELTYTYQFQPENRM